MLYLLQFLEWGEQYGAKYQKRKAHITHGTFLHKDEEHELD